MSFGYSFLLQSCNNWNLWVFCWNNWFSMLFRMMFVMMMFLLRQTLDASWFFSFSFLLVSNISDYWVGDNNWTFLLLDESTKNHSFSFCFLLQSCNDWSLWVFCLNKWTLFRNDWCCWLHWNFFFLTQTFCLLFERHFILMFLVIFFLNQTRMTSMVVMLGKRHVFLWLLLNH
mgnify:CR=1 FL=1